MRFQVLAFAEGKAERRPHFSFLIPAWRSLERIRDQTSIWLEPQDRLGIFRSLLVGEKVSGAPLGLLRQLGFVHLLTATGIHLYALSSLWSTAGKRIGRLLSIPIRIALPLSRLASALSWGVAWLLCGARPGMLRPWIIVLLRKLGEAQGFRWKRWSPLAIALLSDLIAGALRLKLLGDPFDHGRWLYALAVGGGLMVSGKSDRNPLRQHIELAIGSWALAALFEAWHDGLVAVFTPLWSLITIPLLCTVVYPSLLISIALGAHSLNDASWLYAWIEWPLSAVSIILESLFSLSLAAPSIWVVSRSSLLFSLAGISLLAARGAAGDTAKNAAKEERSARAGLLIAIGGLALRVIFAFLPSPEKPAAALSSYLEQLDVGQGDSALVGAGFEEFGLIDVGSARALSADAWVRLLGSRGITRLSWIALTHLDEDHAGGVHTLSRVIPIDCIATSREELLTARGKGFSQKLLHSGLRIQTWEEGCVPFPVFRPGPIHPSHRGRKAPPPNANMSAIWVPFETGGFYLSAGDAIASDEIKIGNWAKAMERQLRRAQSWETNFPRILKISHHGSRSSSAELFIQELKPTEAWISVGKGNRYGHPTVEVLDRLSLARIPVRRTDQEGAIRAAIDRRPRQTHPP